MVEDEKEKTAALRKIVEKYSPEFSAEGEEYVANSKNKCVVLKIDIKSVTGKHRLRQ